MKDAAAIQLTERASELQRKWLIRSEEISILK